jgi:hypothetical protein
MESLRVNLRIVGVHASAHNRRDDQESEGESRHGLDGGKRACGVLCGLTSL